MFYTLYADANIEYGGLFFNPDALEFVEVIDLDSASGVDGTSLITRGGAFFDEKVIRGGASVVGNEAKADEMVEAALAWNNSSTPFEDLPKKQRDLILMAAEAVFSYMGMDGGPDRIEMVIDKSYEESVEKKDSIGYEWGARDVVVSSDPRKAIWKILRQMGVSSKQ